MSESNEETKDNQPKDPELDKLMSGVTIAEGGVMPSVNSVLLPRKSKKAE